LFLLHRLFRHITLFSTQLINNFPLLFFIASTLSLHSCLTLHFTFHFAAVAAEATINRHVFRQHRHVQTPPWLRSLITLTFTLSFAFILQLTATMTIMLPLITNIF
ncbi:unnamed protein product, partial [Chrysoparadoxa australica]